MTNRSQFTPPLPSKRNKQTKQETKNQKASRLHKERKSLKKIKQRRNIIKCKVKWEKKIKLQKEKRYIIMTTVCKYVGFPKVVAVSLATFEKKFNQRTFYEPQYFRHHKRLRI